MDLDLGEEASAEAVDLEEEAAGEEEEEASEDGEDLVEEIEAVWGHEGEALDSVAASTSQGHRGIETEVVLAGEEASINAILLDSKDPDGEAEPRRVGLHLHKGDSVALPEVADSRLGVHLLGLSAHLLARPALAMAAISRCRDLEGEQIEVAGVGEAEIGMVMEIETQRGRGIEQSPSRSLAFESGSKLIRGGVVHFLSFPSQNRHPP